MERLETETNLHNTYIVEGLHKPVFSKSYLFGN